MHEDRTAQATYRTRRTTDRRPPSVKRPHYVEVLLRQSRRRRGDGVDRESGSEWNLLLREIGERALHCAGIDLDRHRSSYIFGVPWARFGAAIPVLPKVILPGATLLQAGHAVRGAWSGPLSRGRNEGQAHAEPRRHAARHSVFAASYSPKHACARRDRRGWRARRRAL